MATGQAHGNNNFRVTGQARGSRWLATLPFALLALAVGVGFVWLRGFEWAGGRVLLFVGLFVFAGAMTLVVTTRAALLGERSIATLNGHELRVELYRRRQITSATTIELTSILEAVAEGQGCVLVVHDAGESRVWWLSNADASALTNAIHEQAAALGRHPKGITTNKVQGYRDAR